MKKLIFIFGIMVMAFAPSLASAQEDKITNVGAPLSKKALLSTQAAADMYKKLGKNDTLTTAFKAKVKEVCQMKGCWVRLELSPEETVLVEFKDYGFFVPKDIAGTEMWVEGKAFINELSEGAHRHLARDSGASEKEIKAIKGSKKMPGFEATGVRIIR
jgi:hypothetical protein